MANRRPIIDDEPTREVDLLRVGLKIDKEALDDEIINQPTLFVQAADLSALAFSRRDEAKAALDQTYAIVCDSIRTEAAKRGEKLTEARVKELGEQDQDYINATNEYLALKRKADEAYNMREGYDQRARMLKELVALHLAGYWSSSSASGSKHKIDDAAAARGRRAYESIKRD